MATPTSSSSIIHEFKTLARLAVPLAIVQVGYHLTGLVDTALAGRVDAHTVAATGLGAQVFFAAMIFGVGICMGVDPLISQAIGAGKQQRARHIVWQGIWVATLIALPLTVCTYGFGLSLELFGVDPVLAADVRLYLNARLAGIWPLMIAIVLRAYCQAMHNTKTIMWAAINTNIFNFFADWLLLFGDAGLEQVGLPGIGLRSYGVAGLGWASTLAIVAQTVTLVVAAARQRRFIQADATEQTEETESASAAAVTSMPEVRPWAIDRPVITRIIVVGTPLGMQMGAGVGVFVLAGLWAGAMGALSVAAHQVALSVISMTFAVCLGVGSATAVEVGRAIGRHDARGTRMAGALGLVMVSMFMTVSSLAMWLVPGPLAGLLTTDPEVRHAAATLLTIAGLFQICDGLQGVGAAALRGAGLTRWAFLASLFANWCLGMPVAAILAFGFDWGVEGLWWGLTLAIAAEAVAMSAKFFQVTRHQIRPIEFG